MTNMEAIKAGTINAAHLLMRSHETGSLEQGKLADIVIADGNPLEDINCLTCADHIRLVMLGGEIKKGNQLRISRETETFALTSRLPYAIVTKTKS